MNSIFTVIVTYNGMQWIEECLKSVLADSTVIVVDNVSKDDTSSFIKKNFPQIILLQQKENLGFGNGNNVGISKALELGADHILLLNQDAKMAVNSLQKLLKFQKENDHYGLISPIHLDWTGNFLEGSFSRYVGYHINPDFYSDFVLDKHRKTHYDIPFVAAACWLLNKKILQEVGGFDPMFFYLGEDTNYCQRVLFHQYKIAVLPDTFVHHDTKDRVYDKVSLYSSRYFYKKDYYAKKTYGDVSLNNFEDKFKYKKRQLLKAVLFQSFLGNLKVALGVFKEYKKFKNLKAICLKSREQNRIKGPHYL